jgi:hypothetical protein
MPIDYQQVYAQVKEIGKKAGERKKKKEEAQDKARELLNFYSTRLDELRAKVDSARQIDSNTRCASPLSESLRASFPPVEDSPAPVTLIAADGSQINPNRHDAIQFCVVNVGAIIMKMNSGEAPQISIDSELLYGDDLQPNGFPLSEGIVALKRDLAERTKLDELSKDITGAVVTFTDGPIELWGAKDDSHAYVEYSQKYLGALSRLQSRGVTTAGYVDKPSANLVVRLLEIASADNDQLQAIKDFHPLNSVTDRWLMSPLLPAGHRSAVFKIQSSAEKTYKNALALNFFYLNVGTEKHPWLARVEIPQWVVDDKAKLDLLHSVLVNQCRMMGSKPYPYLLHRAHETALVKMEEKQQIEQLIAMELRRNNEEMDEGSYKQSAKDLQGRTRK